MSDTEEIDAYVAAKSLPELFGEIPLRPYSPSRIVAAQSMGLLFPFIGNAGIEQFEATNMYPGGLKDTIIVLWLRSIPDADEEAEKGKPRPLWNPDRAGSKPREAYSAATEWAQRAGLLDTRTPRFSEAFKTFLETVQPIEEARFQINTDNETDAGDPKA